MKITAAVPLLLLLSSSSESKAFVPQSKLALAKDNLTLIPRGGFSPTNHHAHAIKSKVVSTSSSSSSLQMTAASGAIDASGGEQVGGGTATIPNEIFNLVKNIVGAGVLSLPAGEFF